MFGLEDQRRALVDKFSGEVTRKPKSARRPTNLPGMTLLGGGIAAILLLGLIAYFGFGKSPTGVATVGSPENTAAEQTSGAVGSIGDQLVSDGWDSQLASNFLDQWNLSSPANLRVATSEPWFRRLGDLVEDRIDESMALIAAGGDVAPGEQFLLSAVADTLKLDDVCIHRHTDSERQTSDTRKG